jgi:hypothetical protein
MSTGILLDISSEFDDGTDASRSVATERDQEYVDGSKGFYERVKCAVLLIRLGTSVKGTKFGEGGGNSTRLPCPIEATAWRPLLNTEELLANKRHAFTS